MRKSAYIAVVLSLLFGCSKMLEEHPKAIATETFYNTADEVASATNAIYSPLRSADCLGGNYPALMECLPDYGYGRGSWAPNSDYNGLDATNISRIAVIWNNLYLSIRNANLVILNAPNGTKISDEKKAEFIGEARFLRAFDYFILVRSWGGVPLRTETNMSDIEIKRSTVDEVYAMILSDATYAEEHLPDQPRQIGTPSKWAAKTLLADIYLTLKQWENARNAALDVINANKYALLKVNKPDDFNNLYGADVATTSEEIFYLKFNHLSGWWFGLFAHHPGSGYAGSQGYYGHYTTTDNPIIKGWDDNDFRKQNGFYKWDIGLGPNTLLYKKYIDPETTIGATANDYPLYRYADLLMMFAEAENQVSGGPTARAVESLNQVHRRAYGYDPKSPSPVDFKLSDYNQSTFQDLLVKERGYETFYEGKRWLELVRLGKAKEIIKAVKGIDIADKTFLFPIPVTETNYNKAIDPKNDQNPGY